MKIKITQEDLAKKYGLSQSYISMIVNYERSTNNIKLAKEIGEKTGRSYEDYLNLKTLNTILYRSRDRDEKYIVKSIKYILRNQNKDAN